MVKFTTFLLASVAILACSTSAQVSTEPSSISLAEYEQYSAVDAYEHIEAADLSEEANVDILSLPATSDSGSLLRRAEPKKPKKPTKKAKKPVKKPTKPAKKPSKLTKEQQLILDTHNKHRARHQAPPLTWNNEAAKFGNNWIQACQFKHSGGKFGENLAAGYKDFKAVIDGWYSEVKFYQYGNPGFSMKTGHFTQVVWKGTKSVGCAKKFCPNSNWTIYICNYAPPGNMMGAFPKNVLPPK
ncbi:hypothetical protein BGZ75_001386 [Mortierella antarctica]|nr:hypothetical protein BGZ67_002572 [Mortierella alpina]KAF9990513.1 hypothetical protein BGZ75_001386 [Mortierella antarctica]